MLQALVFLSSLLGLALAEAATFDHHATRDVDSTILDAAALAGIPKYVIPPLNRDITEWFAIGDSFSAGIGADVPDDSLNTACSRSKMSYPNQMNADPKLPGRSDSRTFVFASCAGARLQDVIDKQIGLLLPNPMANYPKLTRPQLGTVSLSWDEFGFAEIMNSCVYHWVDYKKSCLDVLEATHAVLNDPGKSFERKIANSLEQILIRGRAINPSFQLYVTGYVRLWNDGNKQCDTISWAPKYRTPEYLSTSLRQDLNSFVLRLNAVIQQVVDSLEAAVGGVYFVDEFEKKFDGHRLCEVESNTTYLKLPTDERTWFMNYASPYGDSASSERLGPGTFFDIVDSILIPPKDGKSTSDQIKEAKGNLSSLHSAYGSMDSMMASLNQLAQRDVKYEHLPVIWSRILHPNGSGYKEISSAVIDKVLKYNTGPVDPGYQQGLQCTGKDATKFLNRDVLNDKIAIFCADAAKQKEHDPSSGSIARSYSIGERYGVRFGIDWPQLLDISDNMETHCVKNMSTIMDSCGGDAPNNAMNWKRGGRLGAGWVNYNIVPTVDQGYTPGTCSFHLQQDESWTGVDGLGTQRKYTYFFERATMKDGAGKTIGTLGFAPNGIDAAFISAGDGHPLNFLSKLPDPLAMTPEARGNPKDYIQFTIGTQSWTTATTTGAARCDTGAWSWDYSPRNRIMDCFFNC
ncbi:SGNH hydrolase-type esterase domain-containing protein [Nemania sp. NC0429]|nr:SGNH hydrolase-type esterase domain-containing protein [Nemania sp. NC0429]